MRFRVPRISHSAMVMVLDLAFYDKDLDGVVDAVNIFLFLDLYPSAGLEAALLARPWDAVLGGETLSSLDDTIFLLGSQKVAPVVNWDIVAYQIEDWFMLCAVFLGYIAEHPATFGMATLV